MLPPHTTHVLQPLDCLAFRTFKKEVKLAKATDAWNKGVMNKWDILNFLVSPLQRAFTRQTIIDSFRVAGVVPIKFRADKVRGSPPNLINHLQDQSPNFVPSTSQSVLPSSSVPLPASRVQLLDTVPLPPGSDLSAQLATGLAMLGQQLSLKLDQQIQTLSARVDKLPEELGKKKPRGQYISTKGGSNILSPGHPGVVHKALSAASKKAARLLKESNEAQVSLRGLQSGVEAPPFPSLLPPSSSFSSSSSLALLHQSPLLLESPITPQTDATGSLELGNIVVYTLDSRSWIGKVQEIKENGINLIEATRKLKGRDVQCYTYHFDENVDQLRWIPEKELKSGFLIELNKDNSISKRCPGAAKCETLLLMKP